MALLDKKDSALKVYVECIPIIDGLISRDLLKVDSMNNHAVIDLSLHVQFMGTDTQYAALLDKLQAYINFQRGLKQGQLLKAKKDASQWGAYVDTPLTFDVVQKQVRYVDEQGNPLHQARVGTAVVFRGSFLHGDFVLN